MRADRRRCRPAPARRYRQDEWGYDEELVELVGPFFEFMYERWWRVEAEGVDLVPADGPPMVVANHAGVLPWDATMMSVAIAKHHPAPRQPRFMVLDWAFRLPWVSSFMRRVGGVVASPYNAMRLLEQGHLVMVFPEGVKGAGKPYAERTGFSDSDGAASWRSRSDRRADRAGRGRRLGGDLPEARRVTSARAALGAPYFPITPTFPALGAVGAVPLPSKWRIEFCEPIDLAAGTRRRRTGPSCSSCRSGSGTIQDHACRTW